MKAICLILAVFLPNYLFPQSIEVYDVQQEGNNLRVFYHFTGSGQYEVSLLYSLDNGSSWLGPARSVSGDAGSGISTGRDKIIIWNVLADRPMLKGSELRFKIIAEIIEPEFSFVDQDPQPPGGDLQSYFDKNIRYPQMAFNKHLEGKVFLTFVITSSGDVEDEKIIKGIGYGCDEEALRVVKSMPKWTPGKIGGRAVKTRMNVPMVFRLP